MPVLVRFYAYAVISGLVSLRDFPNCSGSGMHVSAALSEFGRTERCFGGATSAVRPQCDRIALIAGIESQKSPIPLLQ